MSHDTTKLPKWAQDLLMVKERQVRKLEQQVIRLEAERDGAMPDQKPVAVRDPYIGKPVPVAWDAYDNIRFFLGEGDREHADISVRDGALHVMTGATMLLTPSSSNVVLIRSPQRG